MDHGGLKKCLYFFKVIIGMNAGKAVENILRQWSNAKVALSIFHNSEDSSIFTCGQVYRNSLHLVLSMASVVLHYLSVPLLSPFLASTEKAG